MNIPFSPYDFFGYLAAEDRKCVTTRNDKVVVIECGPTRVAGIS